VLGLTSKDQPSETNDMVTYSIGDVAAHLTRLSGEYIATHRVAKAVRRLIARGRIPERRAGRARILFDDDLPIVAACFSLQVEVRES
jgi:hypothetical protein